LSTVGDVDVNIDFNVDDGISVDGINVNVNVDGTVM
jgi:hypothetical protein